MPASLQPPAPLADDLKSKWLLNSAKTYLNHGSFGAVPRCVMDEQLRWRMRIESDPIEIIGRRGPEMLEPARRALADWLGMAETDFGLVTNATDGINAVLRSLKLHPGEELLTTTHVYHAVRQTMKYIAARWGAGYREIDALLPVKSPHELADVVLAGLSDRTRLLVIDHVTSPTALIFPVEIIAAECARRGVDVLIDGAHGPGMLPLNVPRLGSAYYAGNLHKWVCCPKGCAFLWVRPDRQDKIHPLVVSHYLGEGFAREFEWQGTRDYSAWYSIPRALEFMSGLGWDRVMAHNHAMAAWVQQMLCERWGVEPISPLDGSMLGSMVTVRLPPPLDRLDESKIKVLQQRLYDEHDLEVPLFRWGEFAYARPCCQVYNTPAEYERLARVGKMHIALDR